MLGWGSQATTHTFRPNIDNRWDEWTTIRDYSGSLAARGQVSAPHAISIDALGTLVRLEPPVPILAAALAEAGFPQPEPDLAEAVTDEMDYYRANMQRGRDAGSLAALRLECATVLGRRLTQPAPPDTELAALLVASLRFRPHLDALPALDALRMADVPVVVLSNWDCSLPDVLGRLGIRQRVHDVLASAALGAQKPERAAFAHVIDRLGVSADRILHVGDDPRRDALGARAAGLVPVLIDREGAARPGPWTAISDLRELPGLVASRT